MRHRRILAAVAALGLLLAAACGDSEPTATEAPGVTLTEQAASDVVLTALNMMGQTSVSDAEWVALTAAGCDRGAWEWDVARAMADDFGERHPELGGPGRAPLPTVLWILVAQSCPDRIPPEALAKGPPPD